MQILNLLYVCIIYRSPLLFLFRISPVSDIFEQSDIKNVFSGFNGSKIR